MCNWQIYYLIPFRGDEFIRYRIAVCDAKFKFCDAKLNVIRRKLRCKAILTVQKNAVCVRFPCLHECMHLRTVFQCAPCDQRLYAISFYLSVSCLCAGHSILATFRVCHTHVVFLIFESAVLITSCKLRLTAWDVGSSKYFWQVSWVVEVDVERRVGSILKNIQHGLLRWFLQSVQENSSSLRGLQNM